MSFHTVREIDEGAAKLLLLWSFFDNKDLWHGLLSEGYRSNRLGNVPPWFASIAANELEFSRAMRLLRHYSLIEKVENPGDEAAYTTHPVVHKWAYHYQGVDSRRDLGILAIKVLGSAIPDIVVRAHHALQRRILPHAQICSQWLMTEHLETPHESDDIFLPQEVGWLARLYSEQGKDDIAEVLYRHAIQNSKATLGPTHPSTINLISILSSVCMNRGKLNEAEIMLHQALTGYQETHEPAPLHMLQLMLSLGRVYSHQGKLRDSEYLIQKALEGSQRTRGPADTDPIAASRALGYVYIQQGRFHEAENILQQTFKDAEAVCGPTHSHTLSAMAAIGYLYKIQGRWTEAKDMLQRTFEYYQTLGTQSHPNACAVFDHLQHVCTILSEFDEVGRQEADTSPITWTRASPGTAVPLGSSSGNRGQGCLLNRGQLVGPHIAINIVIHSGVFMEGGEVVNSLV